MQGTTPEFIRWALAHECPLRDFPKWKDPNKTERHLRAIRVYQNAVQESRVLDGIAIEPLVSSDVVPNEVLGFRVDDVFEFYGDPSSVASICEPCPANAVRQSDSQAWVGCFGLMPVSNIVLPDLVDEVPVGTVDLREQLGLLLTQQPHLEESIRTCFPRTSPEWYGLWISRVPSIKQRQIQLQVVNELLKVVPCAITPPWEAFQSALRLSVDRKIPLHIQLVPEAVTDGVYWYVDQHCGRCCAISTALTHTGQQCQVCKNEGRPREPQRRFVRGKRPYWKMTRFLGAEGTSKYLERYLKQKG